MDILWWILIFIALMVWIAIAFWPARVAARKGHSFLGYFIFSLFFFQAGGCPLAPQRAQVTGGLWADTVFGPTGVSAIKWRPSC
jgi:hypothetical protein